MPICLDIIYGYFNAMNAELNTWKRDHMACKADRICYLALFRESLLTPALGHMLMRECTVLGLHIVNPIRYCQFFSSKFVLKIFTILL